MRSSPRAGSNRSTVVLPSGNVSGIVETCSGRPAGSACAPAHAAHVERTSSAISRRITSQYVRGAPGRPGRASILPTELMVRAMIAAAVFLAAVVTLIAAAGGHQRRAASERANRSSPPVLAFSAQPADGGARHIFLLRADGTATQLTHGLPG